MLWAIMDRKMEGEIAMENYTDMDRKSDFDYFTCHYQEFFNK